MSAERLGLRHYLLLLGVFLATRVALYALGLRLLVDLSWMSLSDPQALRERLLETLFYFHAFAPGMNLITGVLLKLGPEHLALTATALFWASGYVLLASACRLFQLLGLRRWSATAAALALSLAPQSLYLENFYLYTQLCTALVCWAAVALHGALRTGHARSWFGFFLLCAVLGWLYTVFHLAWFLLLLLAAVRCSARARRRAVLLGALAPLLLLSSLYLKNYAVFGVFGATSWGGGNLALGTTHRMPPEQRQEWIAMGKLSPFSALHVFAPPSEYLPLLPADPRFPWPGSNELEKPSVHAPNFNHGLFLEVNRRRAQDAWTYIRSEPLEYLHTVFYTNLRSLLRPTTRWHKRDQGPDSPHYEHRRVLGGYERVYELLVHRWPVQPVGLYLLFPLFYGWAVRCSFRRLRSPDPAERPRALLLAFCLFQILFIATVSILFTSGENSRYRYSIEPFIWGVTCLGLQAAYAWLAPRLRPLTPRLL